MTFRLSNNTRQKAGDAIVDELDAGSGPGTIAIRTGPQPTNVGDADTGILLGTLAFSDPAFGNTSVSGVATANAIVSDTSADNSGTAGHFRIKDSTGAVHSDGSCGQGSGDLSFNNNVIVAGGTIAISSLTLSVPINA